METTMKDITLKIELPEIDNQDFRDTVDQVQFNIYMVLGQLSELIEAIQENGDPMHWPEGALVHAARGLLDIDAARRSYLEGHYDKALVEAQVASWGILRMPSNGRWDMGSHGLPTEADIRAHMGRSKPTD